MTDREKIASPDYVEILSDFIQPEGLEYPIRDYVFQRIDTDLGITYINENEVNPENVREISYRSIPKIYGLMQNVPGEGLAFDPTPLLQSGIVQVQGAPLNLTGKGVVLGFLDTGIRYEEEVFRNQDGSSRILGIWDQNINTGPTPEGLLYGTEYKKEIIDAALLSDSPREIVPSYDEIGHGTAIASVAAGSAVSGGLRFTGAAPDADIVVVKLRQAKPYLRQFYLVPEDVPAYAESDLITAVKYLESYAISLVRPLVICVGVGTNMGDHEGHSILSGYLNTIATRRGRVVVLCGGNEGNSAHHYVGQNASGVIESAESVEIRVDEGESGFIAELWGNVPVSHAISIRSPGGETTDRVDFKVRETREFSFIYEKTKIRVDHVLVEQGSGEELIFFRFIDPTPGVWTIQVTAMGESLQERGSFHIWLPITEFLRGETYFLRPSPYTTITEPGNTREGITTTFYQDSNNSFYGESGRGFTREENIKPDLCTPGVNISTVLGSRTGSSMGAALLSGICAQFMQWAVVEGNNQWMESRELKRYLIRGAVRMPGVTYPSREWGYGRVNISRTFDVIAGV
ncbi:MAG: S8 family peptidase [Lachnospiraceae bacterium]|nr:S8 family peptidase [Lachnospiraceae bacterium]